MVAGQVAHEGELLEDGVRGDGTRHDELGQAKVGVAIIHGDAAADRGAIILDGSPIPASQAIALVDDEPDGRGDALAVGLGRGVDHVGHGAGGDRLGDEVLVTGRASRERAGSAIAQIDGDRVGLGCPLGKELEGRLGIGGDPGSAVDIGDTGNRTIGIGDTRTIGLGVPPGKGVTVHHVGVIGKRDLRVEQEALLGRHGTRGRIVGIGFVGVEGDVVVRLGPQGHDVDVIDLGIVRIAAG